MTIEAPEMEIPTPPSLALRVKNLMRDVRDLVCDHLELAANSESAADRLQLGRGGVVAVNRR